MMEFGNIIYNMTKKELFITSQIKKSIITVKSLMVKLLEKELIMTTMENEYTWVK